MKFWKSFKKHPQILFYLFSLQFFFIFNSSIALSQERQSAIVESILTGDSVLLKGGKILKYNGLECYSPESKIPLMRSYGIRAQELNNSLLSNKNILIEWGPKIRDRQGRFLGYVYTPEGVFVNEEIIKNGYAKAKIITPNIRYADNFRSLENQAKRAKKGIWEKEPNDPNAQKKLIGEKNTKIYYLPNSPELERIPESQLIYFDSRVDAKAAGYRACFSCRQKGELDESE